MTEIPAPAPPPAEESTDEPPSTTAPPAVPPPAPPPFQGEATVVSQVESARVGETKVHEEPIDPAWIGKRVEYAVLYQNAKGREGPLSEIVRLDPLAAVAPPEFPKAEAADGFVALSWTPPPEAPESLAFSVHRRSEGVEDYPEAPLNPEPLSAPRFEDRTAVFGSKSCYVVAAILSPTGSIGSFPSEEVCITPEDRFAPEAPTGLVAVPSGEVILLSWREVQAPDQKGYRVYRGASPAGRFELLAEVTESSYTDENVAPGKTFYYTVTAIDAAPGVNESRRSEVAEARRSP